MSIQKYEAFLKTVELGSLTKAAQALGYTQSGISHMLNALEADWSITLLSRDRSGVRLTSDGELVLPTIRAICNQNRELEEKIAALHGLESGLVRVGTFSSVSVHWLPKLIKSFQDEYPGIDFELLHGEYTDIETWISQGRADCGFIALPSRLPLYCVPLKSDGIVAILPKGHPMENWESFPIKAVESQPYIMFYEGADEEIGVIFQKAGVKPNVKFTAKDDYAIIAMVESGLGISLTPELLLTRTPHNISKVKLDPPQTRIIGIASGSVGKTSLATRRFMKHVREYMETVD